MAVGDAHVFPEFLTPLLTPTTFLTSADVRGEKTPERKVARLNRVSNSQPQRHESDTLTTELPGRGLDVESSVFPYWISIQYNYMEG